MLATRLPPRKAGWSERCNDRHPQNDTPAQTDRRTHNGPAVERQQQDLFWIQPGDRLGRLGDGGFQPPAAGTKLKRTCRRGLSTFRSTRTTDCHVPRATRPPSTGRVTDGLTRAGSTWSAPWPGDPWAWR